MTDTPQQLPPGSAAVDVESFAYRAVGPAGQSLSGTLEAPNIAAAQHSLVELGLHASEIKPAGKPRVRWPLSGDDFLAFNEQIAQLTAAGMPVEFGLQLIARDMRRGRLSGAIKTVAADLESGKSLPQAIAAHASSFPPLYGPLIEAGIAAGKLSAVLINLGLHMAFVQRMRSAMWRALSYPATVFVMLCLVFYWVCRIAIAPMDVVFSDFHTELPQITQLVISVAAVVRSPQFLLTVAAVIVAGIALWMWISASPAARAGAQRIATALPVIGRPLRLSLAARWCSAAALAIDAGLDLSRAIELAGAATGSIDVAKDSRAMREVLDAGGGMGANFGLRVLPATVPAAINMAWATGNLSETLRTLSQMYERQAEATVEVLRAYLSTILLLMAGVTVAMIALAVMAPILSLIETVSSPKHR